MKHLLIFSILIFTIPVISLSQKSSDKLTKKERKEFVQKEKNEKLQVIQALVESKKWLIKIEHAYTPSDELIHLSIGANFIICETDLATLELPASELVQNGETNFLGLAASADVIMYSLDDLDDNANVKCQIQLKADTMPWIRMLLEINSEGSVTILYTQSDGVNFTLSGTIESQE